MMQYQVVLSVVLSLLSAVGLLLSLGIVITTPLFALYPLSVGAPEFSPGLMVLNAITLGLTGWLLQSGWIKWSIVGGAVSGLLLSALPLLQWPSANQQMQQAMETALGQNYAGHLPTTIQQFWRSRPLVLTELFQGIPLKPIRYTANILFATPDQVPLTLDLYQPITPGQYPGIVVVHGGAWRSGSSKDYAMFNQYLAAQGYTVVAISYRLAPDHRFPAQLDDVQTAIQFIRDHAAQYEIDGNRMAIMGRSAGAHLAMLAAYQPDALPFQALVNYYGPIDLVEGYHDVPSPDPLDIRHILETLTGGTPTQLPEIYRRASPSSLMKAGLPPTLLVYGRRDHIVKSIFGQQLHDRWRQLGNTAIFLEIPWAEHAFDTVFNGLSNQIALYYTERFLAAQLQGDLPTPAKNAAVR